MPDLVTALTVAPERSAARCLLGAGCEAELLERVGKGQVQPGPVVHVAVGRPVQRVGDAEVVAAGHRDSEPVFMP